MCCTIFSSIRSLCPLDDCNTHHPGSAVTSKMSPHITECPLKGWGEARGQNCLSLRTADRTRRHHAWGCSLHTKQGHQLRWQVGAEGSSMVHPPTHEPQDCAHPEGAQLFLMPSKGHTSQQKHLPHTPLTPPPLGPLAIKPLELFLLPNPQICLNSHAPKHWTLVSDPSLKRRLAGFLQPPWPTLLSGLLFRAGP